MAKVPCEIVGGLAARHIGNELRLIRANLRATCFPFLLKEAKYRFELALGVNMIRRETFTN
ncbi:hypothetical protein PH552_07155 [Rhizobium sp. CNPSo 3968]|uniref:hypothetical protein n=1 Tax=Rhizobium sp. CNPSo 3968 TaxID=3021408 RepID=UPI00254EED43|nr:hypothetical protein [Rhizobium sp. CNPSo 3968]MDK4719128.1 hypothetical protein [Rhizobium sp. CNPSo 3968]